VCKREGVKKAARKRQESGIKSIAREGRKRAQGGARRAPKQHQDGTFTLHKLFLEVASQPLDTKPGSANEIRLERGIASEGATPGKRSKCRPPLVEITNQSGEYGGTMSKPGRSWEEVKGRRRQSAFELVGAVFYIHGRDRANVTRKTHCFARARFMSGGIDLPAAT
jgi:hypothetical protein